MTYGTPNLTTRLAMAELNAMRLVDETCPHLDKKQKAAVVAKIMEDIRPLMVER